MKDNFFVKNKSIITFLILEVVALTAFNFGNNSAIFGIVGGALALISFLFVFKSIKNKKNLLTLLIPLGLILIVSIMGGVNDFSRFFETYTNIALIVALPGFLALGFFLRNLNDVKPKTVLLIIGGALAAICLFGLFSTLIEYGLFYSLIYKKTPNYYYNGTPFDVTKEMYWLSGFEFNETFIEYGSLFAVLAASFLVALLFISPKKEKREFVAFAVIGGIGLLTLLIIPNFKALIVLVVAAEFAMIYKFLKGQKKVQKILGFSFLGIIGLGLIFFIIALINAAIGFKFLDRIFVNNGLMKNASVVMDAIMSKNFDGSLNLFGLVPLMTNETAFLTNTGIFEIELLKEVGVFGTVIFAGFIIYMGYLIWRYLVNSKDNDSHKATFIVLLLAFFIYETFFHTINVSVHKQEYNAFLRSPLFFVVLFVMGYLISDSRKKEAVKDE